MNYSPYLPYANLYAQQMTPDQVYSQYQNQQQTQNVAMGQRGDFVEIKDDKVIDNYPARSDGVPTLFFNYGTMTFTSKKLVNGKPCQQSFQFAPLNSTAEQVSEEDAKTAQNGSQQATEDDKTKAILSAILDKLEASDKRVAKLEKKLNSMNKVKKEVNNEV